MTDSPWYQEGLRFGCSQCGNCCVNNGDHSYLYVMDEDIVELARFLGKTTEEFRQEFTESEDGWTSVLTKDGACPFLGETGSCTVYPARPVQCRTWPFFIENLDEDRWKNVVSKVCPGAGSGHLYSAEEVEDIAIANERWYLRQQDGGAEQVETSAGEHGA